MRTKPEKLTAEEEIRQLDNEIREAMLRQDVETLRSLLSEDFVVTNPFNEVLDKARLLEAIQLGRINHSVFERDIEHLKIYPDTAVVVGHETVVDNAQRINRRYTDVWLRRDGRWQLIARHANKVG